MTAPALTVRVRDQLIADGVASVESSYPDGSHGRRGGLEGFRICETLETAEDYQVILESRHRRERDARLAQEDLDVYWEHRYATLQVEHVYDRLRVVWGLGQTFSANAIVQVAEVLERIQA